MKNYLDILLDEINTAKRNISQNGRFLYRDLECVTSLIRSGKLIIRRGLRLPSFTINVNIIHNTDLS